MSVWDTFSASLHLVQEKLEQVLEDSTTEDQEQVGLRREWHCISLTNMDIITCTYGKCMLTICSLEDYYTCTCTCICDTCTCTCIYKKH